MGVLANMIDFAKIYNFIHSPIYIFAKSIIF